MTKPGYDTAAKAGIQPFSEVLDCPVKPDNDKFFMGHHTSVLSLEFLLISGLSFWLVQNRYTLNTKDSRQAGMTEHLSSLMNMRDLAFKCLKLLARLSIKAISPGLCPAPRLLI